jgi:ATP-dependent RNA helicase DOB1
VLVSILKGATFSEICDMTDIFEGSIIRAARRLDEFLNQVYLTRVSAVCYSAAFAVEVYCSGDDLRFSARVVNSTYIRSPVPKILLMSTF